MKLLVANRGEIAVRIMRAAAELGVPTTAVYSEDDARSLHTRKADQAHPLDGVGAGAYLNVENILTAAKERGCDAIHPGYGFLSENAGFARRCDEEGIAFVGPTAETLEMLGDKTQARALAERCGVPLLPGTPGPVTLDQTREFLSSQGEGGAIMIKAVAGGGGRGMRPVLHPDELEEAYTRCRSEAQQAFGNGDLYAERLMTQARHIEVQIVGDGSGAVSHFGERECSLQRRHQKLIELAPCPGLAPGLRARLTADAVRLAEEVNYRNSGTVEFMVQADSMREDADYAFIEANTRLQVEHTITEEVLDIDLVKIQIQLAMGHTLADLGLLQADLPAPRGFAVQVRINMETMGADGSAQPAGGTLSAFEMPSGRGVRTDTCGYVGYQTSPNFDSLLAKLIGHSASSDFAEAVAKTYRALCEFKIEGVRTNIPFLQSLLRHPDFVSNTVHTRFVEDHIQELVAPESAVHQRLFFDHSAPRKAQAGAKVDDTDPLAVLAYGKADGAAPAPSEAAYPHPDEPPLDIVVPENAVAMKALMQGTIISLDVKEGDFVRKGQQILVMNSMKMEHVISAEIGGVILQLLVVVDDTVFEGTPLVVIEERESEDSEADGPVQADLDHTRPDLAEVHRRHEILLDAARPDVVAKRRKIGLRTARENINELCDPDTFVEYGGLVIAAQRRRRSVQDLIERTPADGLVAGIGRVNGHLFDDDKARCALLSYDYTVLAGTQGMQNHAKKDRMFELAENWRIPLVFFTEGGGGRPGDTDATGVAGLDCMAFHLFGRLSGLVPMVGINAGRCFAGNAALLGCCDVVIATKTSNIGMGGPAMIEGGGLGVFRAEEVGPMQVQVPNGVVDIAVEDEAEAVQAAKKYLSYFQGPTEQWECADQRLLRGIIPENRLRIYDVRSVIETMADTDSVLELRRQFGLGMVTSFIRIEGRPMGVVANNPNHLSGAIDRDAADKAARFMQLCDAFDIPLLFLCDTPGIMVGPEVEKTALVRHCCRMFVTGGSLSVPYFTIVLRKSYGLGAQAMAGGSFKAPLFVVAWPTGEFGGMGLEGAVKLGFRKELEAIEDPAERKATFENMVAGAYEHGKALNTATHFEIDNVIDPADSRHLITRTLLSVPPPAPRTEKKRPCVDTW
ncbi:MAG: carbamoyl-phosphate synthase large subunit [Proteobacteria bacterium]|nr:carbamoyl-phosphate synthase large subunit [Pseudomonadota bacterium]